MRGLAPEPLRMLQTAAVLAQIAGLVHATQAHARAACSSSGSRASQRQHDAKGGMSSGPELQSRVPAFFFPSPSNFNQKERLPPLPTLGVT